MNSGLGFVADELYHDSVNTRRCVRLHQSNCFHFDKNVVFILAPQVLLFMASVNARTTVMQVIPRTTTTATSDIANILDYRNCNTRCHCETAPKHRLAVSIYLSNSLTH